LAIPDFPIGLARGLLEDEPPFIDNLNTPRPESWDDALFGGWNPPRIENLKCPGKRSVFRAIDCQSKPFTELSAFASEKSVPSPKIGGTEHPQF
jgi:hypothetical protein